MSRALLGFMVDVKCCEPAETVYGALLHFDGDGAVVGPSVRNKEGAKFIPMRRIVEIIERGRAP